MKVVYVARNPKDVIVSYFHFHKLMNQHKFTGDLDSFAEYFMNDKGTFQTVMSLKNWSFHAVMLMSSTQTTELVNNYLFLLLVYSSPYFPHLLDAWTKRHHPHLLFIFYEDLKRVRFDLTYTRSLLIDECVFKFRIWEVKSKKLPAFSENIPANSNLIEWLNTCALTSLPKTRLSISNIIVGWISWTQKESLFEKVWMFTFFSHATSHIYVSCFLVLKL